ncbi:TonB-dependent siderophore receptor [Azohydromonas lata]|uniref:TonB-dependent siderophore receptor n=1 Tax=Azohydromonas lata TaxID=45677 RepID=A0ABU5IHF9_9BURK|nr:TonB-dependent siderophore receptor [Azohydromonas lata]MDZ5457368.1 TonB-dependent siderophore receptor [Azohydromonas lata]
MDNKTRVHDITPPGRLTPIGHALNIALAGLMVTSYAHAQAADVAAAPAAPASAVAPDDAVLPAIRVKAAATPQESPLRHLAKPSTSGALGEKVVLDTPFSLTVVDSEQISERSARSIGQIFVNDPAVYTPSSSYTTDWWGTQIRGLGVRNMYIDGIPLLLYWGGDFPTEIVESVTALKGLTGFMYGFGEPGGALSYEMKRPKAADATTVEMGWRNPRVLSAHVDTSRRLGEDSALRVNLAAEKGTAYNDSQPDRKVASMAFEQRLSSTLNWFTTLAYEDNNLKREPLLFYVNQYDAAGSGGKLPRVSYDYGKINVANSFYRTKTQLASTELKWQFDPDWSLKTQLGLARKDHLSNKGFAELLNASGDYAGITYTFAGRLDTFYGQSLLQGHLTTGSVRHEIVAGVGLQRAKDRWSNVTVWDNDFNGNLYQDQTHSFTQPLDFSLSPTSADVRQKYAFLSDTIKWHAQWEAIVGVRYTDYDSKDLDGDPTTDSGYGARKASPTLALIWKPDAATRVYGSFVQALEPGTRVGAVYANAGEVLGATVSKQYEMGVKHASRGVDYTAALFRVERVNQMEQLRDGLRYLTQDGMTVYNGIELSGAWQATRSLNLGLGTVFLDASIDKVSEDNAALRGNTPSNAARWQTVANAQYRVPAVPGLKLHGNVRYYGGIFANDANTLKVPAYTLVNAGFTHEFTFQGRELTLIGNVNNLFNRKYWAGGGWSNLNVGEARNVSLNLKMQF